MFFFYFRLYFLQNVLTFKMLAATSVRLTVNSVLKCHMTQVISKLWRITLDWRIVVSSLFRIYKRSVGDWTWDDRDFNCFLFKFVFFEQLRNNGLSPVNEQIYEPFQHWFLLYDKAWKTMHYKPTNPYTGTDQIGHGFMDRHQTWHSQDWNSDFSEVRLKRVVHCTVLFLLYLFFCEERKRNLTCNLHAYCYIWHVQIAVEEFSYRENDLTRHWLQSLINSNIRSSSSLTLSVFVLYHQIDLTDAEARRNFWNTTRSVCMIVFDFRQETTSKTRLEFSNKILTNRWNVHYL